MGKAIPVSFIGESVGQIWVVGEWLWPLLKVERAEQESGWAHSCCHPAEIRERHWQGERNVNEGNLRENWDLITEDRAGVSNGGAEKASGFACVSRLFD